MSRRRRHTRHAPVVWLDWTPDIAALFMAVPATWQPPLRVRFAGGFRHTTVIARFLSPAGHYTTARVRLDRTAEAG